MTTFISSGNVSILLPIITLNYRASVIIYIPPGIKASENAKESVVVTRIVKRSSWDLN